MASACFSLLQLQEIEYSGKTLRDMAAGFTLTDPGRLVKETAMEAHSTTQGCGHAELHLLSGTPSAAAADLGIFTILLLCGALVLCLIVCSLPVVCFWDFCSFMVDFIDGGAVCFPAIRLITEYGGANLAVSRLSGSLAFLSAGNATVGEVDFTPDEDTELTAALGRHPAPLDTATGLTTWNFSSPDEFWRVQGREELEVGADEEEHLGLSTRLTAAFRALSAARVASFSLSWWTKGTGLPGWTELVFSDPALPNSAPKLTVRE